MTHAPLLLALAACAPDADPADPADTLPTVERGPVALPIEGDPNGLWWDADAGRLLVADDNGNRVLAWTDDGGFELVADLLAAPPEGPGLGGLVRTSDGTVVVTRFGHGVAGDVMVLPPGGAPAAVPGIDVERRRLGVAVTPDDRLFDTWFVRLESGERVGAVGELSLDGTEVEVITGLKKPVGAVVLDGALYISDQDQGQLLRAPLTAPSEATVFAEVELPDLLGAGPDGSLFAGSAEGALSQISAAGEVTLFASGFQAVRGVAWDAANRRLFVADHDGDETDGVTHALHILPVD